MRRRWRRPLLAGLCCGLSYGLVQRLKEIALEKAAANPTGSADAPCSGPYRWRSGMRAVGHG